MVRSFGCAQDDKNGVILSEAAIGGGVEESFPADAVRSFGCVRCAHSAQDDSGGGDQNDRDSVILSEAAIGGGVEESFPVDAGRSFDCVRCAHSAQDDKNGVILRERSESKNLFLWTRKILRLRSLRSLRSG